jgi:hypothetical protein
VNTWADIKAAFYDVIGDSSYTVIPAATAVRWANLALQDLCEAARYRDIQQVSNVSSGTATYTIADDVYDIFRVEYDGEALTPISGNALRRDGRDWKYRTGTPKFYTLEAMYYEHASPDKVSLRIWETPSSNMTNGLRIWYHGYPDAVSDASPSADIDVPDWAVSGVLFYMLSQAYESEYSIGMKNFDSAAMYWMMYEDVKDRLTIRSRDRQPKQWVCGEPAHGSMSVLNRLPDRVPAP